MSAALAKAPNHPEAQEAPKAANNELHFKNGGVLGLVESFAKLAKGVTYDAGVDTFGGKNGAIKSDHPAADNSKSKELPKAEAKEDHPKSADGKEGAHPEKDWVDTMADWAVIYAHSPLLGSGIKWFKNKLFPEIHEVTIDYDHIGDQLLHKLKADKKVFKNKKKIIDHHDLEGFCKGLDIPNLQRQFRMFVELNGGGDPGERLQKALKSEPGRKEIEKEIAALLDMTGEVDRSEVEHQTDALLERLGVEEHGHRHPLDSRVDKQHEAMVQVVVNAKKWLTEETLDKIYDRDEKNFKIDFENFGDFILETVNPENRDRYLRSINPKTFEATCKIKFPYLTNGTLLEIALKKDTEREKALTQFRQFTGVDYSMNMEVFKNHIAALKKRLGEKPKDKDGGEGTAKEPLFDEYDVLEKTLNLVEKTMTEDILQDLFEGRAKFEWSYEKYANFGATILTGVTSANRSAAMKAFDKSSFNARFNALSPKLKHALLETDVGKKIFKDQVKALFKLDEPFDFDDLQEQAKAIREKLDDTGDTPVTEVRKLVDFVEVELRKPGILEKITVESIEGGPENFVKTFSRLKDKPDIAAYVRGFDEFEFKGHFPYLVDPRELDELIASGSSEDLKLAKKQVVSFVGWDIARVNVGQVKSTLDNFKRTLQRVESELKDEENYKAIHRIFGELGEIETCLTEERLDMLFDRDNPNKNFSYHLNMVTDANSLLVLLSKLNRIELLTNFDLMRMPAKLEELDSSNLGDKKKIYQARKQLRYLLGLDPNEKLTAQQIKDRAAEMTTILTEKYFKSTKDLQNFSASAAGNVDTLIKTLQALTERVDKVNLDVVLGA